MKTLFVFLLAAIAYLAVAQDRVYDSFLDEGKIWTIKIVGSNLYSTISYEEYRLTGDVTIGGVSYKQLLTRYRWENDNEWSEWKKVAYIGQDNDGKVYYYADYGYHVDDYVTMDFSLEVGDVFVFDHDYGLPWIVTAVSDTILGCSTDKIPRKCIHLSRSLNGEILDEDYHRDIWIEGIGSLKYGLLGMSGDNMVGGTSQLLKCTKQEDVIYQYNDVTSILGTMQQPSGDGKCYSLQGLRLKDIPRKGVYISGGKKYVK